MVEAMSDLVKGESERIDSRFLTRPAPEPSADERAEVWSTAALDIDFRRQVCSSKPAKAVIKGYKAAPDFPVSA